MLESLVFVSHLVISAAEIIRRPLLRGSILYFSVFVYYINRQSNIFLSPPLQVLVFDKVVANMRKEYLSSLQPASPQVGFLFFLCT